MDPEKAAELFNDSYLRCMKDPAFMDKFYTSFLACSPEVREKFRYTDIEKQKRVLGESLLQLMLAETGLQSEILLDKVAEIHSSRKLDIKPHLYKLWRDCMLETVEKCDPRFDEEIRQAWEITLNAGIIYMISKYE